MRQKSTSMMFQPDKKRILITGASGLIGRILYTDLAKNPHNEVYASDKQLGNSERYKIDQLEEAPLPSFPAERFFLLDITDSEAIKCFIQAPL